MDKPNLSSRLSPNPPHRDQLCDDQLCGDKRSAFYLKSLAPLLCLCLAALPSIFGSAPLVAMADEVKGEGAGAVRADNDPLAIFAHDNLVAWCIVPFDDRERTPIERSEMLNRLGLKRYAYDYRANHIPTFDAEMEAIKKHGIELTAWWFPTDINDEARLILDVLKRHGIKTQLWVTGGGGPTASPEEQRARVVAEAARIRRVAQAAAQIGCRVSLYNHGGWFGEPENQIEIIRELNLPNVGIVYNLHHGHDHIDRFAELLEKMQPYLDCLNLNGMVAQGDKVGKKILPIGDGDRELGLLRVIRDSGYRGPIGILNHTQENAETRLTQNLKGLDGLVKRLRDEAAGAKPPAGTQPGATQPEGTQPGAADDAAYSQAKVDELLADARNHGDAARGAAVFASAKYACLNCHKIGSVGAAIGPELTGLSSKRPFEQIAEAVYWPQRTVAPEYRTVAAMLSDGQVIRGYVVGQSERSLTLLDPANQIAHTLPRDEIEGTREVGSLMPEGLMAAMTMTERSDLLRFLIDLGREGTLSPQKIEETLSRARPHTHGPATFPLVREPLDPKQWPNHSARINRERVYDFYARQAIHFRGQPSVPPLLAEFPGLDGPPNGHWGNQDEEFWKDNRWNETDLGPLQSGVFHGGPGLTVPRGVCVRVPQTAAAQSGASVATGDSAKSSKSAANEEAWWACFNPQTLTYAAAWKGKFIDFSPVRSGLINGLKPGGPTQTVGAGQAVGAPFRYRGFYRHGDRVGFAFESGGVEYLDVPQREGEALRPVRAPLASHPMAWITKGGPNPWPQRLDTPIEVASGDSAYLIDTIRLPLDNPWKALLYVGDIAFDDDGSMYVCTMHGDVWRVTGIDHPSTRATWTRFASGLHQPLGMVVDRDGIFVLGRDQITRLHDLNADGAADFYECYSSAYETSPSGHDYICGLQRDAKGFFYTASGNQGLIRITPDGKGVEVLATGVRNPDGLGLYPDGAVTVPNSEGNWVPSSMVGLVLPGKPAHFGYMGVKGDELPTLPMVYMPRALDNSSGGQAYVADDRWGPMKGQMIHFSYGAASHFLLLRDEVDGVAQGAMVPLVGDFLSGVHRGRFRPQDGQLYVGGAKGWGNYAVEDGNVQRVRYTGRPFQAPIGVHVHENGVWLKFAQKLDPDWVTDLSKHFAQVWNYRYGPGYGSPEYSPSHPATPGHDPLSIGSVRLLAGGDTLFVELPDLQPVNQLHLYLQTSPEAATQIFVTVNRMDRPFADFEGYVARRKEVLPHPIVQDVMLATRSIPNPWRQPIDGAREVRIECTSSLSYATPSFRAKPGEAIKLTLVNPDVVPHNWAIVAPGSLERIGNLTNRYIADPEAPLRHYVPDSPEVLAYTDIVLPKGEFSIHFRVPDKPGRYPYLCTFPGHWSVMNGEMVVEP